ncbi:MAG: carbamoyl-phosphate synthase large subunit [Candidatus Delongbacteria bacterium]
MPARTDLHSILVLGAGPIVIGQACEFDYSGTQACRALKGDGYRVILVNSNPATIMTEPDVADATYLEPVTPDSVAAVLRKERPDALLPTVGGQTALDCAMALERTGLLKELGVELIGASAAAIEKAEDRELFRRTMEAAGLACARGGFARSVEEGRTFAAQLGFPLILRPSYTLGGSGGAIVYNPEELEEALPRALAASPIQQVLVEESLLGWKEFELEVVRDRADNAIIVCSIENIDPMGVHTGDSVTVAPQLTLSDREYQRMRDSALACLRAVGVDTGGSNVQFAVDPASGRQVVIEMNPRVSRSSALASKATGFPIAKVAARLAVGWTLDELPNDITGTSLACFEPALDYVVVKAPRFHFEKFPSAPGVLGVQMQSVGEAMALGRSFREALQKAFRSLEEGLDGLEPRPARGRGLDLERLRFATPFRLLKLREAFLQGMSLEEAHALTRIDPWFLGEIRALAEQARDLQGRTLAGLSRDELLEAKRAGFSDGQLGRLLGTDEDAVAARRAELDLQPSWRSVDTCAGEFRAPTPFVYSSWGEADDGAPLPGRPVLILGSGPNRIGQGIEFDCCCVQAVQGLRERGIPVIMVNANPETVSTDPDLADRLYFEPLTFEHVWHIARRENARGVLVQFGGQTPLKIAARLQAAGLPVLGTPPESIEWAEDRERFGALLDELGVDAPAWGIARSLDEALAAARRVGFPALVRPSWVLGGRGMEIVYDEAALTRYVQVALEREGGPVLVDAFLEDAFEFDVDALCDGVEVRVAGVLQQVEEAGVHSGDSSCVLPPYRLDPVVGARMLEIVRRLALRLGVRGLLNVQFALQGERLVVLEVNPRASRTVPFLGKVTGIPLAAVAARLSLGGRLADESCDWERSLGLTAVKRPVFPWSRFPRQDVFLSPEMKSTGEVIGLDRSLDGAWFKAAEAASEALPATGCVLFSVNRHDKLRALELARDFAELGFRLAATAGTARVFRENGLQVLEVFKVGEGRPDLTDELKNGRVQLVVNTPLGERSRFDEQEIGRTAVRLRIPLITTLSGAAAALRGIRVARQGRPAPLCLQELHAR